MLTRRAAIAPAATTAGIRDDADPHRPRLGVTRASVRHRGPDRGSRTRSDACAAALRAVDR
ncbi:hypothetical protein EV292_10913 [Sphingomonas sp. BK235]|nr:hypothetical protein EV292_10913 [Sphingomonas sp. BK235]